MLQTPNRTTYPHQQQQQQHNTFTQHLQPGPYDRMRHTATPFHADLNNSVHEIDLDSEINYQSLSSSPVSTQSLLSQYSGVGSSPLSTFDSIPTPTLGGLRGDFEGSLFEYSPQSNQATLAESSASLFPRIDLMQTQTDTTWMRNGPLTPRSIGRFSHHRESSLSSLGSNGPASPYSHNTTNPQIAVTDSLGDSFHGLPGQDDFNYQLAPATKPFPGVTHDNFYANLGTYASAGHTTISYPQVAAASKRRNDRGLLQPSENPIGSNRSQPVSVASSITSDSPATPAGDLEEDRRNKNAVMHTVPKLDRTLTDVYADELYNPDFTITNTSAQLPVSPTNDLFVQRIQAANNQHLTAAVNSPASATSRERSPFRHGAEHAPLPTHDFSSMGASQARFGSAQQMREQNKALQDARAVQQQLSRAASATTPPTTISPKDAMLEFHESDADNNFPLFPQQNTNNFNMDAITKATSAPSQPAFHGLTLDTTMFNNYLNSGLPTNIQVPQQYPFIARPQPRQESAVPSLSNASLNTSRVSSVDTGLDSVHSPPKRPADVSADGGTYTCTYHGCTMPHGLNGSRQPGGMTSSLMSQAGPHRCDRINPSTGKPCNTVFSRPYDLTRHEDTIHNARKQKVRCNLCTDEKTFSRADALTRHYRVCHPDVEFPGKQRRRAHASG
ncbi:hypothetical protein B0T21DRAFT_381468 [Apiosordaria backusii]|uniref:C2H2-type domain-containing protein n=1 Tax=Apiosordaria backusii TaxID=314023 RepID=A0AA40K109_9PEZI|nr:hypothetical protein B0T21DRAFT_381468 [Apiosordaria backusii]